MSLICLKILNISLLFDIPEILEVSLKNLFRILKKYFKMVFAIGSEPRNPLSVQF